jgi:hypothetical protein
MDYPLSTDDIKMLCGHDIKIYTYPQLQNISTLDDLFDNQGRCVILYLTENERTGHWVCLFKERRKNGDTVINYFDPFGYALDGPLRWIDEQQRLNLHQSMSYLKDILKRGGAKVYYNTIKYQDKDDDVATCGRHVATRLLYKNKSPAHYYKMLEKIKDENGLNPDEFVTIYTDYFLDR